MRAVVLAGGRGERLRPLTRDVPKALVPIAGQPLLAHQIANLSRCGITDILLVVGHHADAIRARFGDGREHKVALDYFVESTPLGTAGALALLRDQLPDPFLLLYGDLMVDMDFGRMLEFHDGHPGSCSIVVHPNDHPADSDVVVVDGDGLVRRMLRKNTRRPGAYTNRVNAGVMVLGRAAIGDLRPGVRQDIEQDVLLPAIHSGSVYAYRTSEYIKDMGTFDRLAQVREDVAIGRPRRRNLTRPQRAVFLDRDGTINDHVGLLSRHEDLRVGDEVVAALRSLNGSDFLTIVATNQPVVARNMCTVDDVRDIHRHLETMLGARHVYVDDIYFCPHHEAAGYPEEDTQFKIACECRKPKTGMIQAAARDYGIDLESSYLIGDTTVDVQTGKNAGLTTILLGTGEGGRDGKYAVDPDHRADNLLVATELLLAIVGKEDNGQP